MNESNNIEYRILLFLENNSSFDELTYYDFEKDIVFDTIFDMHNKGLIESYLHRDYYMCNVNLYTYRKRLTTYGKKYLEELKSNFNHY